MDRESGAPDSHNLPGSAPVGPPLEGVSSDHAERPEKADVLAIACTMATVTVFAIVFGATLPLSTFVLERTGASETAIGISTAMTSLGLLLTVGFAPALAIRFGAWRVMAVSAITCAITLIVQGLFVDYWAWLVLRFIIGTTSGLTYVLSESWVNMLTPDRIRGRVMGIYATIVAMGFAIGPLILATAGTEGVLPFAIISGIMALTILAALPVRKKIPPIQHQAGASISRFARLAPTIVIAIMAFAMMEGAVIGFMPLFGQSVGLNEQTAIVAITVVLAGYMGPQIPIGWLAEKVGDRILLIITAAAGTVISFAIPITLDFKPVFWVLLFLWGSCGAALYTLALIELGNRFSGHMLVTGNAAIGVFWGLGGIIGPPLTGISMDVTSHLALPVVVGVIFATVLSLATIRSRMRAEPA